VLSALLLLLLAQSGENVREAPPQRAPELTRAPRLVESHPAEYPPEALALGEQADVSCLVDIDAQGHVTNVQVEQGAGPEFDEAAVAAIRTFRFEPAEIDRVPAPVRIRYVYHFVVQQKRIAAAVPDSGKVRGSVVEAGTRRPIPGADLAIADLSGTTDAGGRFEIEGVPVGAQEVRANAAGFAPGRTKLAIEKNGTAEVRLYLRRSEVSEFSAVVQGERPAEGATRRSLTHDELINVPGSMNDPIRAVQNLPGLARAPFLGGQLLVRGTPPGDSGIYLDGQRIPVLYHFLGGPSVVNEQLLDRIDFYPGGYGAYYGRNLAGAIDVGTRKADASGFHGSAAIDLLQASAFVEGPIAPRTSAAIAVRRSYIDFFLPLFLPDDPKNGTTVVTPVYWDYQARVDHRLLNGDELSFFAIGMDDKLALTQKGGKLAQPIDLDTHTASHQLRFAWRRTAGNLTVSIAPLAGILVQSFDTSGAGQGAYRNEQSARLFDWQLALRGEAKLKLSEAVSLRSGVDVAWDRYDVQADLQSALQVRSIGFSTPQELIVDHVQPLASFGEFAEAELRIGRLVLVPGVRFDQFHWREHTYGTFDPRLWARYALTESTALKGYAGLYHQAPNPLNLDLSVGNPNLLPERSWQAGLGVEHHFSPDWSLSVEGFYIRRGSLVSSVPAYIVDGAVLNPLFLNAGIGRSYGAELILRREFTGRFYGWVAYTLSRSDVLPYTLGNTEGLDHAVLQWRAFNFDQPHNLTIVAGFRPTPGWELSTRYRFVSGNPLAPVAASTFDADSGRFDADAGTFGAARVPAFSQLDARAQYTWTGNLVSYSLYLDVQNVLNRRNPEIHQWDYRYRQDGYITGLPILPTLGFKVRW
jgi:TonB family protein